MKIYKTFSLKRSAALGILAVFVFCALFGGGGAFAVSCVNSLKKLPIYCVKTDEKKIAITFDAAWSADDTDELIEIMEKFNAHCTFFAVGDWLDKNPKEAKRLFDAGNEIANHSNTHPAFSKLSKDKVKEEIVACNAKIKAITGKDNKLVRAPSGDYDNKSVEAAEELNMKMIQWSIDSLDWKKLSSEEMTARLVSKAENGAIMLFHNGIKNTPSAFYEVLKKLTDEGYSFVTVSELIYWDNYKIDDLTEQESFLYLSARKAITRVVSLYNLYTNTI